VARIRLSIVSAAIEAAAFAAIWSTIILLPLGAPALVRVAAAGHMRDVIVQASVQGVLSGVVAIVFYGVGLLGLARHAVRRSPRWFPWSRRSLRSCSLAKSQVPRQSSASPRSQPVSCLRQEHLGTGGLLS
jgi:hypothetical protein